MKLIFKKDSDQQISVFSKMDGIHKDFSYVDMIKNLMDSGELKEPHISEGFSEAEKASIKSMVNFINKEVSSSKESEEA